MASDKANVRQRKKAEKSTEAVQDLVKKDTPADGDEDSKQRKP